MHLDFAGTDPQVNGPNNVTKNGLLATVFYSLKALIDPTIPSNAGIYRAFSVEAEPGTIINATDPAPVGARIDTCMRVARRYFQSARPGCSGTRPWPAQLILYLRNLQRNRSRGSGPFLYAYLETIAGGSGAQRE